MLDPTFVDELLAAVDLKEVIIRTGHAVIGRGPNLGVECPRCHKDATHCKINLHKQLWHCFVCGAGGNAIHWLRETQPIGFMEAVVLLATWTNIEVPKILLDNAVLTVAAKHYETFTSDYLQTRGISEKVIRRFHIGFAPGGTIRKALTDYRWNELKQAGLLHDVQGKLVDRLYRRVVVPITYHGEVVDLYTRAIDANTQLKHLYLKGTFPCFGLDEVRGPQVIVTESVINALTLYSHGLDSIIANGGARRIRDSIIMELAEQGIKEVVVAYDTGDLSGAGQRGAMEVVKSLKERFSVSVLLMPVEIDINVLWQTGGESQWQQIWQQRIEGEQFIAGCRLDQLRQQDIEWYIGNGLRGRFMGGSL